MDDEYIQIEIDDLVSHVEFLVKYPIPSVYFSDFYGHGRPDATTFVNKNDMRLFFLWAMGLCNCFR